MTSLADTPLRLALHACCGPCLIEPFDALVDDGAAEVVVVYANPNIHPTEEYQRRLATLRDYARASRIDVVELPYEPEAWRSATQDATSKEERCRACYRLRLGMVAQWAAEHSYEAIATTLSVSPYQDSDGIADEGRRVAESAGVRYLDRDYRERYAEATRRSRELGMYRQNYCGCSPSQIEAAAEREARRAARRASRGR